MQLKLLWFDDNFESTLEDRIVPAVDLYQKRYKERPTMVLINRMTPGVHDDQVAGMQVIISGQVPPDHFWLGVEDRTGSQAEQAAD